MLLKYELKKLFGNLIIKVMVVVCIALTVYTGISNRANLDDEWLTVFKTAEDKVSIENYAAVLIKGRDADPFFWQVEMQDLPFDQNYIMKEKLADYNIGDKVKYDDSPIYKTTVEALIESGFDEQLIMSAYGALFSTYKNYYHWEENRQNNVSSARKYYNWFAKRNTITDEAREMKRRADIYSSIKEPENFVVGACWQGLIESFLNSKASFVFVIIAVAFVFGVELRLKTRNLIMVTKTRNKVLCSKILTCILISIMSVLLEAIILLAINLPGGYFPGLFTARIQNILWFFQAPFNLNIFQFLLMILLVRLLTVITVAVITAFTAVLIKSITGAALITGFITFIPLLFDKLYMWSNRSIAIFKAIYNTSLMALHSVGAWADYVPKSFMNIPFMLHEYIIVIWSFIGLLAFVGCTLLYNRRLN